MKKFHLCVLGVALALVIGFTSCQKGAEKPKQLNLVMATGGTSGTYYPYGGAVAQALGDAIPGLNINVQATGASAANLRLLVGDEADIAIVQNDVMSYAFNGTESFASTGKLQGFSTMATVYAEVCQIIADPASGIKSVADLKGKRVSIGDAGSGVESNARQILAAYGLSFDDLKEKQNLGFGDSASAMKDKKIDAFFVTAGTPTTAIMELASTNDITVVPIDADKADALSSQYPFYTTYVIPKDTYKGMTQDVPSVAVKATLVVRDALDEETVYNMTRALFEKREDIAAAHAKGKELSVKGAIEGVSVPFHKGAQRFFKEIGALE